MRWLNHNVLVAVFTLLLGAGLCSLTVYAEEAAPGKQALAPELEARIRKLIAELGDNNYDTREAASWRLLRIGRPALELLRAATGDADAERVRRAEQLVAVISRLPDPAAVDPKCTNGYMSTFGSCVHFQTLTPEADIQVETARFRAARTLFLPQPLEVQLYAGPEPKGDAIATATVQSEWTEPEGKLRGVTRFFQWFEVPMKARLEKEKTYCLAFRSPESAPSSPWLINCFYRDAFAGGEHRVAEDAKAEKLGTCDLVFELRSGEKAALTSVPADADLSKQEEFGIGHDGTDLRQMNEWTP